MPVGQSQVKCANQKCAKQNSCCNFHSGTHFVVNWKNEQTSNFASK